MIPLQAVALALVALTGLAVVLVRELVRQAIVNGVYALSLVALFVIFQAPDVALSELVVGSLAFPLVLVVSIARVYGHRDGRRR